MMMNKGSSTALLLSYGVFAVVQMSDFVTAFVSHPAFSTTPTMKKQSSGYNGKKGLYMISSWGTKGPPSRWSDTLERENPAEKVQAYLPEPAAVEARSNINGICLVSGLVQRPDPETSSKDWSTSDQFLFDLLNHEESAFEFEKIRVYSGDSKFAKKRLLSRSARYTGLLDKLDFTEGTSTLPTSEQLDGVKSWLAVLNGSGGGPGGDTKLLESVKQVAATAKSAPSVENVAILLTEANELDAAASKAAVDALKGDDKLSYTLVAVGHLEDTPEGGAAYDFEDFGSDEAVLPDKSVFSREEAFRVITELLQLECGTNRALAFAEVYNVNATVVKLVKGLREAGYARPQEIDHMIRKGPEAYKAAIDEWKKANPDADKGYTRDAWWEAEIYQKSRRESAARDAAKEQVIKDKRTEEVEAIAREWAKREYFRQSMAGTLPDKDMTEEAFAESVWERAMLEGDLKYKQSRGEIDADDEEAALADFKTRQQKKEETMLKRAKAELAEILEEDNLDDGDDDDSDDDDDKK